MLIFRVFRDFRAFVFQTSPGSLSMHRYTLIIVLSLLFLAAPTLAVDTLQVNASDPILDDWWWTVLIIIAFALLQSARVVQARRKLQKSVEALSNANNELSQVNVDLQREQVLERLRGQAQGMQSSEDIGPVVEAVYRELTGLGLPKIISGIGIYRSESEVENWMLTEDGRALEPFITPQFPPESPIEEARRRRDDYHHSHLESEEVKEHIRRMTERGNPRWKDVPEARWPQKLDEYRVFFDDGRVVVFSEEPVAEEYLMLIKRFGKVFGFAHSRWEELKQKEAQNRRLAKAHTDLKNEITARENLDAHLQQLRYLDRIRYILSQERSPGKIIDKVGKTMIEALTAVKPVGLMIHLDDHTLTLGQTDHPDQVHYPRPLTWADRERGHLHLYSALPLSEAQQRILLDETISHLVRTLETRELEFQLVQSARLVSLGQMAASMAHELNQPLSVISATAGDIYQRQLEGLDLSSEKLKTMMQDVLEVVERMDDTIDHLRIFSRDTSEEPGVPFQLNDVVHSSLKMIRAQLENHGIDLHLNLAESLPPASSHPHQLDQVLLNLLANARDALDEKEGTSEHTGDWGKCLTVHTRHEDSWLIFEVEDNGIGMDETARQHIFEPFFTTKEADKGTGLGLSISYAIVQNHKGRITCESRKGEGTVFRVELPMGQAQ